MKTLKHGAIALVSVGVVLGMASCANPSIEGANTKQSMSSSAGPAIEAEVNSEIAAMVPADLQERGTFTVGINPGVAPLKFVDEGKDVGLVPDLMDAAGDVMGLEMEVHRGSFDAMIPGLEAKRFDVIGSLNDLEERRDKIDFIDYLMTGTAVLTSADFEPGEITREDMCGLSIGYVRGNVQQSMIEEASQACVAAGNKPINGVGYGDSAAALLAIRSDQEDAFWGDIQAMEFNAQQSPEFYKVVFEELGGPYGIGVNKDDTELRDALQAALLHLEEQGIYDQLLEKWGQQDLGMPEFPLNSGPSQDA